MEKERLKSTTITIYPSLWNEFSAKCNEKGYDKSKLLRLWVGKWLKMKNKRVE